MAIQNDGFSGTARSAADSDEVSQQLRKNVEDIRTGKAPVWDPATGKYKEPTSTTTSSSAPTTTKTTGEPTPTTTRTTGEPTPTSTPSSGKNTSEPTQAPVTNTESGNRESGRSGGSEKPAETTSPSSNPYQGMARTDGSRVGESDAAFAPTTMKDFTPSGERHVSGYNPSGPGDPRPETAMWVLLGLLIGGILITVLSNYRERVMMRKDLHPELTL